MDIIAVANRKGGTGKTTIASHLAGALAHQGFTVCLIDTDSQGHASLTLGLKKAPGLFRLLVDTEDWNNVLYQVAPETISSPDNPPKGKLYVLPSDEKTQAIPSLDKNPFSLTQRLQEVEGVFDYVIIDTAPTTSLFDTWIYLATQGILYVTECETLSLDGLRSGLKQVTEFGPQRKSNGLSDIQVLGIIPNKFREKTATHTGNLSAVRERFKELVWDPIALRIILAEATAAGKLLYSHAPHSEATAEMWNIAQNFDEATKKWHLIKQAN